jgi:glycosyltransferase involved in cell wall biosynthesis
MAETRAAQLAQHPARRMSLRVLSVAFPFAPVSADPVGGAEQVLAQIDRHLVERGHESMVIAVSGSSVRGRLVALPLPAGEWSDAARARQHACVRAAIQRTLAQTRFDLVHCHGVDFADYLPPAGISLLVTLHLPLDRYPTTALRPRRLSTFLQPVSREQCRGAPPDLALLPPIHNGVADNPFALRTRPCETALALGRICPEKGFDDAIRAARMADADLCIAGAVFPWPQHLHYAQEVLAPMLDARRRWIGALQGLRKQWWLARARCVLIASCARETSSLVAMEALAAGTPVIAYPVGAIPELIEDGMTGFLVDGPRAMAAAIKRAGEIDRRACLRAARERCRLADTLDAYLALYMQLTTEARAQPARCCA